jgi:hypothetical protein
MFIRDSFPDFKGGRTVLMDDTVPVFREWCQAVRDCASCSFHGSLGPPFSIMNWFDPINIWGSRKRQLAALLRGGDRPGMKIPCTALRFDVTYPRIPKEE